MTIHEREALDITCQADANPPAHEYRWRKDGREMREETAQLLTIPAAQPEDMARYTCEAVNVLRPTGQEYPQHATGAATIHVFVECKRLIQVFPLLDIDANFVFKVVHLNTMHLKNS